MDARENTPNASAVSRRAATTVMTKIDPFPATSAKALYPISFAKRNELSSTVSDS